VEGAHSDLEELVQVGGENGDELESLQKWHRWILGECQYPAIEIQPTKFAVDEQVVSHISTVQTTGNMTHVVPQFFSTVYGEFGLLLPPKWSIS
jgi:hypothetical protein